MRLGGTIFRHYDNAKEWVQCVKEKGYEAVICPIDYTASDGTIEAYKRAAKENHIIIGEVGIWNNPLHPDRTVRNENIWYSIKQLELADELGANCCVNIGGTYNKELWYGSHSKNFTEEAFGEVVETTQKIIDKVAPKNTFYTLEPSPWMYPDSIESYLDIIKAVDRNSFAVHLDPVNMMYTPRSYYSNGNFLKECIRRLGKYIKSCHIKDLYMHDSFTLHIQECAPGQGILDVDTFIEEIDAINPDMPVFIEHLNTEEAYDKATFYLRQKIEAGKKE